MTERKWDPRKKGQYILSLPKEYLPPDLYTLNTDGKENLITQTSTNDDPQWKKDFWEWVRKSQETTVPTLKEKGSEVTLAGMPIYLDLARDPGRDEGFIDLLETVRTCGGGVIIYLDTRDPYGSSFSSDRDRDYHYALLGIDLTTFPEDEIGSLWDDADRRDDYASFIIPLPMLVERLGYVEIEDPEMLTDDEIRSKNYQTALTLGFSEIADKLNKMFNGKVRLGLRLDWDPLFNANIPYGHKQPITDDKVTSLFNGPLIPLDEEDEEKTARLKDWLLYQEEELLNRVGISQISAGSIYHALLRKSDENEKGRDLPF